LEEELRKGIGKKPFQESQFKGKILVVVNSPVQDQFSKLKRGHPPLIGRREEGWNTYLK